MATLVLTTVGTAIGGPVGGAIGALIGNQVDQRFLAPRRQGARLGALTVQTSAYGQPIPKIFGTLRVAGTVIWATDLREEKQKTGGGKGRPGTTSYSYSASFAVAISGRRIQDVHRIWADGKLLRGAVGDWKSETGFRLHKGDEGQAIDPLLAAAEGQSGTPAYRGLAYAVFEDMQLADFGNRIPSLTFEVEADATPVSLGQIANELSGGAASGETDAALGGYAAGGDSVRAAIETLGCVLPVCVRDDGHRLILSDVTGKTTRVDTADLGSEAGATRVDRRSIDRQAVGTLPDEVSITYYEPSRDYQAGLQRARRAGGPARRSEAVELAAALDAGNAKAMAERHLAERWAGRATGGAALPWRHLDLRPGDDIMLDETTPWKINRWTLEGMVLTLKLRGVADRQAGIAPARPGRATASIDLPHGPTRIALMDLPPLSDEGETTLRLWLAAAGESPAWRRAAVIVSIDDGASWSDAGATALPAIMGAARTALPPGDPALFDTDTSVEVRLLNDEMTLMSRDDDAVAGGANAAMLGSELIQFGKAVRLANGSWRLSRLLRGRRGTEFAIGGHAAGEAFVLIDRDSLLPISVPSGRIGGTMRAIAVGVGDGVGVEASTLIAGNAVRPPAPVHLRARRLDDGGLRFSWTRRSRSGWVWADARDAPIGEEQERYQITIQPANGTARTAEIDVAEFLYTSAMIAVDAMVAGMLSVSVVQVGTIATSLPVLATFDTTGERS